MPVTFRCRFWQAYKERLRKDDGSLPGLRAAVAGSLAGMTECSVNTPFEVGKPVQINPFGVV